MAAPLENGLHEIKAEKAAIPEQEHAGMERTQDGGNHGLFAAGDRSQDDVADGVRAEFTESQDPYLGEGIGGALVTPSSEDTCVLGGIGDIKDGAIDPHQPPGAIEGVRGTKRGHGDRDLVEEFAEGVSERPK